MSKILVNTAVIGGRYLWRAVGLDEEEMSDITPTAMSTNAGPTDKALGA